VLAGAWGRHSERPWGRRWGPWRSNDLVIIPFEHWADRFGGPGSLPLRERRWGSCWDPALGTPKAGLSAPWKAWLVGDKGGGVRALFPRNSRAARGMLLIGFLKSSLVGSIVGNRVGSPLGSRVGLTVGVALGSMVGAPLGSCTPQDNTTDQHPSCERHDLITAATYQRG
jgi:hypothetical protein